MIFYVILMLSILCIIVIIILVGLDNNRILHSMGSLCDGMTTNNIGMWLSVKYGSHEPIKCIF